MHARADGRPCRPRRTRDGSVTRPAQHPAEAGFDDRCPAARRPREGSSAAPQGRITAAGPLGELKRGPASAALSGREPGLPDAREAAPALWRQRQRWRRESYPAAPENTGRGDRCQAGKDPRAGRCGPYAAVPDDGPGIRPGLRRWPGSPGQDRPAVGESQAVPGRPRARRPGGRRAMECAYSPFKRPPAIAGGCHLYLGVTRGSSPRSRVTPSIRLVTGRGADLV
jgi:hypothetical protein